MKFLYILTSGNEDLYYEQIYLSITSLLLYNPEAFIVLLTDDITVRSLTGPRSKILELVKECKVISLPTEQSKKVRSRLLKTNMRNLIEGKFLYESELFLVGNAFISSCIVSFCSGSKSRDGVLCK